jgi:hypothetical protein
MMTSAMTLTAETDTALRFSRSAQQPQHQASNSNPAAENSYFPRQVRVFYWQKLVREGVPKPEAKAIATVIAHFDISHKQPSSAQKRLIAQYSAGICRAQLWRSALLLPQ